MCNPTIQVLRCGQICHTYKISYNDMAISKTNGPYIPVACLKKVLISHGDIFLQTRTTQRTNCCCAAFLFSGIDT